MGAGPERKKVRDNENEAILRVSGFAWPQARFLSILFCIHNIMPGEAGVG